MLFDNYFFGFLPPRLNYFLKFSSCGPWRVFGHSNSPPHRALGRYRHTSSSRQIRNILCWLEILNYCPDGGNGNFHCSSSFLKVHFTNLWSSIIFCCTSEIYSLVFSHCDGWLREFGLCVPHIYNPVEQEVMAGQFHAPSHPGVLKNLKVNGNILQRYFTHKHF